jgi:hypothetical protein
LGLSCIEALEDELHRRRSFADRGLAKLMDHYDHYGLPGGNALVLRAILERDPRTLREYFSERASHEAQAFVGGKVDPSMRVPAVR